MSRTEGSRFGPRLRGEPLQGSFSFWCRAGEVHDGGLSSPPEPRVITMSRASPPPSFAVTLGFCYGVPHSAQGSICSHPPPLVAHPPRRIKELLSFTHRLRFDLPAEKVPGTLASHSPPAGSPCWSRPRGNRGDARQKTMRVCTGEEEAIRERDENE